MRIKKLRLKNGYKRFHDLTIDLGEEPARIVALVGPNGCGKSSVLDGMLVHARQFEPVGRGGRIDNQYHSMDADTQYNFHNIEIEFLNGPFNKVRESKAANGKQNTIFSFRSPYRYNSNLKIEETRAVEAISRNNYGAGDASSLDDKMEENYRRLFAKFNAYLQSSSSTYKQAVEKIVGDLNDPLKRCLELEVSSLGNVEASQGTLYFRKPGHPKEFEFNVLSSGEKEVVDILLDLYLRADDFTDSIFLLDEPELHINTSIQKNLLIEINRMVGENCQIWITTHSIGFLRALQSEMRDQCQVIHFRPEYELASKARVLQPILPTAAAWRELFSIALDDLSELISPKQIIYCEGRDRPGPGNVEKGLDARVFNAIFAEEFPETMFVSSGGGTELDQRSTIAIAIIGKVFPTVEIMLVKDRDMASGQATDEAVRQQYLADHPANHRVLRRWELENYLYDKEVLKAYCTGEKLTFDEASYDALVTNIVDQNVKDETGKIKTICGLTASIAPDKFKLKIAGYIVPDMAVYADLAECIFDRK